MDLELENRINEAIEQIKPISIDGINFQKLDPVAKMMLVALINEVQKISDQIDSLDQRIVERYCTEFIPRQKVEATPALAVLCPTFSKEAENITVGSGVTFTYKIPNRRQPLGYIPLLETLAIPCSQMFVLTPNLMKNGQESQQVNTNQANHLWIGIDTKAENDCLKGLTMLIKGTKGVAPEHIVVGTDGHELDFATASQIENMTMAEPFDAQQASGEFFSFVENWKESLFNMDDALLLGITDGTKSRDRFKPKHPKLFEQWFLSDDLERLDSALWIRLDFPEGYTVPDTCEVVLNAIPVVNVEVCSLTLTESSPIAKLQKQDDTFFLRILETSTDAHKQGFSMLDEEVIVRDYDAACYHNGDLYRDVRNLYNRFVDDYYAFIEYNDIKDRETRDRLRETINKIANNKDVREPNKKFKFDSGTYVMKNIRQSVQSYSTKVSYLTTQGAIGNTPLEGQTMENKQIPAFKKEINVVVAATGGTDKASVDDRYELLRYYALTNDRLYTKMDIDAFLRKEIMAEFGKEEFQRIIIKIGIEGAGGPTALRRGLYIDIEFKDKKNFEKAKKSAFDKLMQQRIENKSCISMPIIVKLRNLEE